VLIDTHDTLKPDAVDAGTATPEDCALEIKRHLDSRLEPHALARLASSV
jgi:hypothetical protein